MWVFGYGSLIWKVDFPVETKLVGYIKGFVRRFYQHSVDHRGRPECPGRVVTLIPADKNELVWGVAYKIPPEHEQEVTDHLDYREKTGYKKEDVEFYPVYEEQSSDTQDIVVLKSTTIQPFTVTLYIGTEDNAFFAGPAPIEDIAKQIFSCQGPSGTNKQYLYNLAAAMRKMAPDVEDHHLFELEEEVMKLDKEDK